MCRHYLGLDVHDAGRYFTDQTAKTSRPFAPGMVLTVEPGLYIPPDDRSAPSKYRGIGIRIEDDVLVTEDGNLNVTARVPKNADEIEALMNGAAKNRLIGRQQDEFGPDLQGLAGSFLRGHGHDPFHSVRAGIRYSTGRQSFISEKPF